MVGLAIEIGAGITGHADDIDTLQLSLLIEGRLTVFVFAEPLLDSPVV